MSNVIFKQIKKQNSERFAKTLNNYHNGVFEIENIVSIVKHAGHDVSDAEAILPYLMTLLQSTPEAKKDPEDPFVLLGKAGYTCTYADTLKKQNKIRQHFSPGEELCTFNDPDRFKNYYILNCVKKNVKEIKRDDFRGKEKREDEYGTSVISIQVAKRGGFVSIKNRYNHTVPNCDNTFNSNPDNIIGGLSEAIQKHFNVSFSCTSSVPDGFILVDGNLMKVLYEISGVFFGEHCYAKNGVLVEMNEHEYLFDYFVFNAQSKTFRTVCDAHDCFADAFNEVYGGKTSVYVKKHEIYDGDVKLVGVR